MRRLNWTAIVVACLCCATALIITHQLLDALDSAAAKVNISIRLDDR